MLDSSRGLGGIEALLTAMRSIVKRLLCFTAMQKTLRVQMPIRRRGRCSPGDRGQSRIQRVGQAQVGQAQVGQAQVGQAQVGQAQVGQAQVGQAQVGQAQVGQAQVGAISTLCDHEPLAAMNRVTAWRLKEG